VPPHSLSDCIGTMMVLLKELKVPHCSTVLLTTHRSAQFLLACALTFQFAGVASAQDWKWAVRATGGAIVPITGSATFDPTTEIDLGAGPVMTIDVIRSLACNLEFVASGVATFKTPVAVTTAATMGSAGSIAPSGVQFALAFKPCQHTWGQLYLGPLVGAFEREQTEAVIVDGQRRSFSIPGGWGIGAIFGYRRDISDVWGIDLSARWQRYRAPIGDGGHISVNPFMITGGIIVRF
jgi:hypothetical protein